MDTKNLIQDAALELFSKKGYGASSVRDIASKIGIKDSSLYFHYKNKQAILDSLMDRFTGISEQMMSLLNGMLKNITAMDDDGFCAVTEQYIQRFFMDDFINRFIMVMNHERVHDEQIQAQYTLWCIKKPIEFQGAVIEKLQDMGYLKKTDPQHTALEYYSPIFLFFNQYMNRGDTDKAEFKKAVMTATRKFLDIHREGL